MNREQESLSNQDATLRRLLNGLGDTNGERTDPPLLVDSSRTRNQTNGPSNVSDISSRGIHSPFVLDSKPPARSISPVRTSSVTKSTPAPSYHSRQAPARSISSSPTSTGRKAMRMSPTYPNSRKDSASSDRPKLPPAILSMLDNSNKTIEIMPGMRVPLRGAEETWKAIEQDFFLPVTCYGCTKELCCIQDASYVLCPACRVVGPMDTGASDFGSTVGVGLGFSLDDLYQWQSEIAQRQRDRLVPDSED
jgi:ribosomal protein S27E